MFSASGPWYPGSSQCQHSMTLEGQVSDNCGRERNLLRAATQCSARARLGSKLEPRFKERSDRTSPGLNLQCERVFKYYQTNEPQTNIVISISVEIIFYACLDSVIVIVISMFKDKFCK